MEDLIACLYPAPSNDDGQLNYAIRVVNNPKNKSRFIPPLKELPELPCRGSRESTAPLDEHQDNTPPWHYREGLQLTFNHGLKGGSGIVIGTDLNSCDIVLPTLHHISGRHCYLTFDEQRRLVVRDCSRHGTIVTYNKQGGEKRRVIVEYDKEGREKRHEFTWIIGRHEVPDDKENIIIEIHENLKLQIVVSKPTFTDMYMDNVDHFLKEAASNAELPLGALGIQSSVSTAAASGTHTPKHDPILLERGILGEGAFSVVSRVWDVSTGLEYASKKFHNLKNSDWKKEASLMKQTSHGHIVRLEFEMEAPSPQLVLEYLPLGNLEDQHRRLPISDDEVPIILQQSLSALTYLHGQTPSIAHRDIKPQNILVQSRKPFHIKLADFGLSKASDYLATVCGTLLYAAPEIVQYYGSKSGKSVKYTNAVDIWSLGVVIFQYGYGLPHHDDDFGIPWCRKIIEELDDWDSDGLTDILSDMLVMNPKSRDSAKICLRKALLLPLPDRSLTPTPASGEFKQSHTGEEYEAIELYHPAEECSTSRHTGSPDPFRDSEIQRYIRSNVSLHSDAPTLAEKRKRLTQQSTTSSASSERRTKKTLEASSATRQQHNESCIAEGLQHDPSCAGSFVAASGQDVHNNSPIQSESAYARGTSVSQGRIGHEQITEPTLSESYLAARLLHELRDG